MTDFARRVALVVDAVPPGRVVTYGQVAALCGRPRHARQVGQIVGRGVSRQAYKVVGAGGRLSGARAFLLPGLQAELLRADGVRVSRRETVPLGEYQWRPTAEEYAALERRFAEEPAGE